MNEELISESDEELIELVWRMVELRLIFGNELFEELINMEIENG
jgi:hypothetical protein